MCMIVWFTQTPPDEVRLEHVVDHVVVAGEDVEGQGLGPGVDEVDGLGHRRHGEHGQQRAEDLLLHDRRVAVGVSTRTVGAM